MQAGGQLRLDARSLLRRELVPLMPTNVARNTRKLLLLSNQWKKYDENIKITKGVKMFDKSYRKEKHGSGECALKDGCQ